MAQRLSVLLLAALLAGAGSAAAQTDAEAEPLAPEEAPEADGADAPAAEDPEGSGEPPAPASTGASSPSSTTSPSPTTDATTPTTTNGSSSTRSAPAPSRATTTPRSRPPGDAEDVEEEEEEEWGAFYIQLLGGYSYANVISFSQANFLPETERVEGSGFFGGAGLGFRVHILTFGAQATLASYAPTADDGFELGTVIGTIGLHLPVPGIQPYFRVGAGYAWMGKANYADPGISETRVYGFVIEGGFGVDIKLGRAISLGLGVDAAYLNLGRQSASEVGMIDDVDFEEDGDAVGYQVRGHVHLTFHI
jgi:hypothetical protein